MKARIIGFICFFLAAFAVQGQHQHTIGVRSHVRQGVIKLRWATSSPMAWKQSLTHGFRVERYTVVRQGVMLDEPEKVVLTPQPLKPRPLDEWKDLATSNNFAAVIAQAIYGEDFSLSQSDKNGLSRIIAMAQELEQRHLLSLYAADLSYPAALMAGWALEDKTAKAGEKYLYRVISAVPEKTLKIEMGSAYTSLADEADLPQPQQLAVVPGDKTMMLVWDYAMLSRVYNAYFIEKSEDGKTFKRLSDLPLTNMNGRGGKPTDRMYYTDTLAVNARTVYYRLVGVNAFGEMGPPSDVVKGEGKDVLVYVPHIERAVPDDNDVVTVAWEFDARGHNAIKGFELRVGFQASGPFKTVVRNIPVQARTVTYDSLMSSNYFVIAAVPHTGEPTVSFPVLVQPSDTIPPAIPQGLTGVVDSSGVVRLTWKANTDRDLHGYRIYRGQNVNEELIPLNDVAIRTHAFTDTLDRKSLNTHVYYAVTALDRRYNQSAKSAVAPLTRPEVVPPSQPLITVAKFTGAGIALTWATGGEENIRELALYRREGSENRLVTTLTDTVRHYTDKMVENNKTYTYTLIARTHGGLASAPSPDRTVQAGVVKSARGNFAEFTARRDKKNKSILLQWKHDLQDVKQLTLYKGENKGGVSTWKVLPGFEKQLEDKDVTPGTAYEYIIRATFPDGKTAGSATVKIEY
jgi:uncharacterized protein